MSITWEKPQKYSNLSPDTGGGNTTGLPGFWFGPETLPNPATGNVFNTRLTATNQLTSAQPIYQLAMVQGVNISQSGDKAVVLMHIPNTNVFAVTYLSYVGSFTYMDVIPPTPSVVAEFAIKNVQFIKQIGDGQQYAPLPPDEQQTYLGLSNLAAAVQTGKHYLYLQLVPNTGFDSLNQGSPATPGSPVTLSNVDWTFDTGVTNIDIACFLPGSMIMTDAGPRAVETLAVGDLVLTGPDGNQKLEPITWAGRGRIDVQPHLLDDRAGYAVCIRKNALGDGCPDADLYVTSEHTLYLDGHFVPVRMLVNHRSIHYDRERLSYDYYHFETAEHSIVRANSVMTESYLSGSSRRNFHEMTFLQEGNVVAFPPSKSWEKDACAPLTVDTASIQPLHEALDERARALGFARQVPPVSLVQDSDFHLVTNAGDVLYPVRRIQDRAIFLLPEGVTALYLRSRTSRPCDTIGPYVDDRRFLGVLVGAVELYQEKQTHSLTSHMSDPHASGWDVVENSPCRWTNGNALLSLEEFPTIHERDMLSIQLLAEGPYVDEAGIAQPTISLPESVAQR